MRSMRHLIIVRACVCAVRAATPAVMCPIETHSGAHKKESHPLNKAYQSALDHSSNRQSEIWLKEPRTAIINV